MNKLLNKQRQQIFLIAALVLLSASAALGLRAWLHPPFHLQAAQLLPEPIRLQGQQYGLTFMADQTLYLDQGLDYWVLLYFGNTSCAACEQDMQALAHMLQQFEGVDAQYKPKVIFISLDPERDNLDQLTLYTKSLHAELIGATGRSDELARLSTALGVSDEEYRAKHAPRIFILDPQLRYIGSFTSPNSGDALYADMQQLIHQLWRYHLREPHSHKVISAP